MRGTLFASPTHTPAASKMTGIARTLLYAATRNIMAKWTMPIPNWASTLNQLAIRFEGRLRIES